jgi:uncharacterized protein
MVRLSLRLPGRPPPARIYAAAQLPVSRRPKKVFVAEVKPAARLIRIAKHESGEAKNRWGRAMSYVEGRKNIAIIGAGVSGLSCAWLLSQRHKVTLFEAASRLGGHIHTVDALVDGRKIAVDTGFIVYNEATYPNLTALFAHIGAPTAPADMTFSVSLDQGGYEYAGSDLRGLLAQPGNVFKPRFWAMLGDLLRFYRHAPRDLPTVGGVTLSAYLDAHHYTEAFRRDHLYPMAAAIWSTPVQKVGDQPAAGFVRFCENHGLLRLTNRPVWRSCLGGSRTYVEKLIEPFRKNIRLSTPVVAVIRDAVGVEVVETGGEKSRFDHVVLATHADQALALLADPSDNERRILGAFRYARNEAVLHRDASLMPRRRAAWAAWNYLADGDDATGPSVTYWMNRLQQLKDAPPLFVTLNPRRQLRPDTVIRRDFYEHPMSDLDGHAAQARLWTLQGGRRTWFCGAHFGAGFHEDGLQAGLAVAEQLGGLRRPWRVADESGRIFLRPSAASFGAGAQAS